MRIVNIVLTALVGGLFLLRFVVKAPNAGPYELGSLLGGAFAVFLFSFLVGKFVWFVAKKNQTAGRIGYALAVMFFTLLVFASDARKPQWTENLADRQAEYREQALAHLEDPENVAAPDPNAFLDATRSEMQAAGGAVRIRSMAARQGRLAV